MTAPKDSYSDLAAARLLAGVLQGKPAPVQGAAGGYTRFAARPRPSPVSAPAPPAAPVAAPVRIRPFAGGGWVALIDWCLASFAARAALVVDGSGLLIASRGGISNERAEEIGARLVIAMQQADRFVDSAAETPFLAVEAAEGGWITAFRRTGVDGSRAVLAVLTKDAIDPRYRGQVDDALRLSLAGAPGSDPRG